MNKNFCKGISLAIENSRLSEDIQGRFKQRTAEVESDNVELKLLNNSIVNDLRDHLKKIDRFVELLITEYAEKLGRSGQEHVQGISTTTQKMSKLIDGYHDQYGLLNIYEKTNERK